jgi:hypothetical protein
MSWRINNVTFEFFGVGVLSSQGLLDMPATNDATLDWLDRDMVTHWLPLDEIKYKDRDIQLTCYLQALTYETFKEKIRLFWQALTAENKRTLYTPYTSGGIEVSLQKKVDFEALTFYSDALHVGKFTLVLTVSGDTIYKQIAVYQSSGVFREWMPYDASLKISKRLMG